MLRSDDPDYGPITVYTKRSCPAKKTFSMATYLQCGWKPWRTLPQSSTLFNIIAIRNRSIYIINGTVYA